MHRILTIASRLAFLALLAGGSAALATDLAELSGDQAPDQAAQKWHLKLTGASVQSTGGGGFNGSVGIGLGVEYRASEHLGFEVSAVSSQVDAETGFQLFGLDLGVESSLRVTPILARLNFHLTPGHKADLYLGPVAGWVRYGDLAVRLHVPGEAAVLVDQVKNKDGFAWGGHIGLDVPFGSRGFFFTSDATYLKATAKPESQATAAGALDLDLDPLIVQVGLGVRF
jgi:outer membrane protein W